MENYWHMGWRVQRPQMCESLIGPGIGLGTRTWVDEYDGIACKMLYRGIYAERLLIGDK